MQAEFDHFLHSCTQRGFSALETRVGRLPVARFPELSITLARGGVGKAQFALQTQHLLDACPDWALVICAGAAGALIAELSVGDIVVASATVEHDYNNGFNERPAPRFDGALSAIASLRRVSLPSSTFGVHVGTVASGDEDVMEVERRRCLHQTTGALVVAWEGAGGARACAFSEVPFVEIRGVTDRADHNAPSDFENNLEVAINNVAVLITSWVLQSRPQ
jgi:adenosylhomocysteine nucleosidase